MYDGHNSATGSLSSEIDYSAYNVKDLKKELKARNLSVQGLKADLVKRLHEQSDSSSRIPQAEESLFVIEEPTASHAKNIKEASDTLGNSFDDLDFQIATECGLLANTAIKDFINQMGEFVASTNARFDALTDIINNLKQNNYREANNENSEDLLASRLEQLHAENEFLREKNTNMSKAMADVNARLREAEDEKKSLLTALKLMQADAAADGYYRKTHSTNNTWTTATGQQNHRNHSPIPSHNYSHNRFEVLSVPDDAEPKNADEDVKIITAQGPDKPPSKNGMCTGDDNEVTITTQGKDGSSSSKDDCVSSEAKPNRKQDIRDELGSKQPKLARHVDVAIVGDSMLKYVNPSKLRKSLKRNVNVKTFPGAKVVDMHHYVKPTLNNSPDYLIMHVGTNDLKQNSPHQISMSITNLGQEINRKYPTTKLIISELITRNDDPQINTKVKQVNTKLLQVCTNNNWGHISHKNIVGKHLNPYGVHLNKQGTATLAKNVIDTLKINY
jgi:predicted transcriptional regulator